MKPLFIDIGITEKKLMHIKKIDTQYLNNPFHFHPNCELVYIEEGYGKRVIGDNVSNFNEGDLLFMGPDLPHIWTNDDAFYKGNNQLRAKAVVIYFAPDVLDRLLEPTALKPMKILVQKSGRGLVIKGKTKEIIRQKLTGIAEKKGLTQLVEFISILDILSQTKEIKYLSNKRFVNTYNERDANRINSVYQFLMQNFRQDIQLNEVADIAHMAPTSFCRFFKQRTNMTFSRFLNELRIKHACDLLNHPDKTIAEISYESGYHNTTNFNNFFREITGLTPSGYRKKLQ